MSKEFDFYIDYKNNKANIAIFGLGKIFLNNKHKIKSLIPVVYVDNDVTRHGTEVDGIKIVSVQEMMQYNVNYVIVMCKYYDDIIDQLIEYGFSTNQIFTYKDMYFLEYCQDNRTQIKEQYQEVMTKNKYKNKKIALITPEMSLTGAIIALFHVALLLKRNGFSVTVVSAKMDRMEEYFRKNEIKIIHDPIMKEYNAELKLFLESLNYVWVNTMVIQDVILNAHKMSNKWIW